MHLSHLAVNRHSFHAQIVQSEVKAHGGHASIDKHKNGISMVFIQHIHQIDVLNAGVTLSLAGIKR